jgi:kumamolisin
MHCVRTNTKPLVMRFPTESFFSNMECMSTSKVVLPGSHREPIGTRVGDQPGDVTVEVSVILKPQNPLPVPRAAGQTVSRDEFASKYGADPALVEELKRFARENNLTVGEVSLERRTVKLEGTAADMMRAFDVQLGQYEHLGHHYRARSGPIKVPSDLASHIEAVLGLDNRPQAKAHFRIRPQPSAVAAAASVSYSPRQIAQLYNFPLDVDGAGETIGILELGGGYKPADLQTYFAGLAIKEPKVITVSVDKAKNSPTNPSSADGEVLLDIEVIGAVAPGARIAVYFAPNTDQGFQDALTTAIHDKTNKPSVISISWGGPESSWTAQAMDAFDSAAQAAAALGVTVCAASGDDGSSDGVTDGKNHVDFPSSSPHILACGGTSLQSASGSISSESVWNDGAKGGAGGGGFSTQFALPAWQSSAGISGSGRGVPDVSGDADPQTGYNVLVDGQSMVIGGTSAVAPLWSGLIALLNQKLGKRLGFVQPALYGMSKTAKGFHDITAGSNGAFSAGPGWDPASGLGSPSGQNLLSGLSGSAGTTISGTGHKHPKNA